MGDKPDRAAPRRRARCRLATAQSLRARAAREAQDGRASPGEGCARVSSGWTSSSDGSGPEREQRRRQREYGSLRAFDKAALPRGSEASQVLLAGASLAATASSAATGESGPLSPAQRGCGSVRRRGPERRASVVGAAWDDSAAARSSTPNPRVRIKPSRDRPGQESDDACEAAFRAANKLAELAEREGQVLLTHLCAWAELRLPPPAQVRGGACPGQHRECD
jgi:hypothetical protein